MVVSKGPSPWPFVYVNTLRILQFQNKPGHVGLPRLFENKERVRHCGDNLDRSRDSGKWNTRCVFERTVVFGMFWASMLKLITGCCRGGMS